MPQEVHLSEAFSFHPFFQYYYILVAKQNQTTLTTKLIKLLHELDDFKGY